jgi:hypothetical protein
MNTTSGWDLAVVVLVALFGVSSLTLLVIVVHTAVRPPRRGR